MRTASLLALVLVSACSFDPPPDVGDDDDAPAPDARPDEAPDAARTCTEWISFDRADGIYAVKPDGTGLHSIVTSGSEKKPLWSPDGGRLLFLRTMDDQATDIWVVNADGTGLANLTEGAAGDDTESVWSPDGTMIAFTTERNYSGSGSDVYVMNADGSSPVKLADKASSPTWSPDSRKVALASYAVGSNFQIYAVDPNGEHLTNISNSNAGDNLPLWSPDGSRIAFTSLRGGFNVQLYVMNADGSQQKNVTPSLPSARDHVWSADGSMLAFTSSQTASAEKDIYVVKPDGTGPENLTDTTDVADIAPQWSRDASHVAFVSHRDGNDELYRLNVDGTGPLRLTSTDQFSEQHASWGCTPDE